MTQKEALKRHLARQIERAIRSRDLTQTEAGLLLGIPQPRVSELMHERTRNLSADRLMRFLTLLGHDVQIRITRVPEEQGRLSVVAVAE